MEAALAFLGGPFLSSLYEWMFDKVESFLQHKFNKQTDDVMAKLQEWKTLLPQIKDVIDKVEAQETAPPSVGTWLSDIRYLVYDMEDVLDEFDFEVKTAELQAQVGASTSRPSKLPRLLGSRKSESLPDLSALLPKINDITIQLQRFEKEGNNLLMKLIQENVSLPQSKITTRSNRPPSTSLPEPHVYGREEDRLAILDLLQRDDHEHGVCVIPLVGMGGIGKTTLAQLVYNDDNVKAQFHLKAWVCVSDDQFDVLRATKSILQEVAPGLVKEHELDNLDVLQIKLKVVLAGKKFLLVLDDFWSQNYELWSILHRPFLQGEVGSKIIVTTRDYGVASMMKMGGIQPYTLKTLSHGESMKLFSQHALGAENFEACLHLKPIAEEIVGRCKGLPLAAKTLGGLLRGKLNKRDWDKILNSRIWDLPNEKSNILPALRLSYYHLSSELKRCFTYFAMFPKDYEFDEDELVLLWMAEGFLKQTNEIMTMEDLGHQYFEELLAKGFFQPSNANVSKFVMHDLIHDLAQSIVGSICFHLPYGMEGNESQATWENIFHFSFMTHYMRYDKYRKFEVLNKAKRLRTFLALHVGLLVWYAHNYLSFRVLDELLLEFKCLRILSLRFYKIGNIPNWIGGMKHLRHLDLSYSTICSIPESVSNLIFLLTLSAKDCKVLTKLPDGIGNLIDLHHLDIRGTDRLKDMPIGIHLLKNLQTLSKFIVSKAAGGLSLQHLKDLPNIRGKLSIENLVNVEDIHDAKKANLGRKKGLQKLILQWTEQFNGSRNEIKEKQVLNSLQPQHHLEDLTIAGYCGIEFPSWMGDPSSFAQLSFLELRGCKNCCSLPSVGRLHSLKELIINDMEALQTVRAMFYGNCGASSESFSALEKLKFENMGAWEVWCFDNGSGDECAQSFPKLCELKISNCPKLRGNLLGCHSTLRKLIIWECPELTVSFGSLPSLEELDIDGCRAIVFKNLVDLTSLTIVSIRRVLVQVAEPHRKGYLSTNCLKKLLIDGNAVAISNNDIRQLESFPRVELPPVVELLWVSNSNSKYFPDDFLHSNNSRLKMLKITGCTSLEYVRLGNLPATLESIEIYSCSNLRSLIGGMMGDCRNRLPATLKKLVVTNCNSLQSLPDGILGTLETLEIMECCKLEIPPSLWLLNFSRLRHLTILGLHHLESLEWNAMSFTNLKHLCISTCSNLKRLPDSLHQLVVLEALVISCCPSIETFPKGGLPPNLLELVVCCENMKQPITDWRLEKLHSLKSFAVSHICPPDGLLPASLTSFTMHDVKQLKSISKDFLRSLTTLKELCIFNCPKLSYFPKDVYLPPTLEQLRIWGCPHLQNKCRYKGEYWNLIVDIPGLSIG